MNTGEEPLILFYFDAFDPARRSLVNGGWWARSSEQAYYWLEKQGYADIRLRPVPASPSVFKVKGSALAVFYRQMAVMFPAGVPLTEALRLASFGEDRNLGSITLHLCEQIRIGHPLSHAMRFFPSVFDPVVTGLIAASERSGRLAHALARLADVEERRYKLVRAVTAAVTYPALLSLSTLALTALFFFYIFPINQELFASLQLELPALNRWVGKFVAVLTSPLMPVLLLASGGGFLAFWRSTERRRRFKENVAAVLLRLPPLEPLAAKARALRMLEILGLLLEGGGTVDAALKFMLEATSDTKGKRILTQVRHRIMNGEDFAKVLESTGYFPPLVCSLLDVGHETGRLVEMARKGAEICEEDVRMALETASSLLEPLLLAGAGVLAGLAVITSALPMITLLQRL